MQVRGFQPRFHNRGKRSEGGGAENIINVTQTYLLGWLQHAPILI